MVLLVVPWLWVWSGAPAWVSVDPTPGEPERQQPRLWVLTPVALWLWLLFWWQVWEDGPPCPRVVFGGVEGGARVEGAVSV